MARRYRPIPPRAIRIPTPDTTQQTDVTCGASSLQSVAKYFGVGPDDEYCFARDMRMDYRIGSHPDQVIRAARKYGLSCRVYDPMTLDQLRSELRRRHPVLLMIQAWGEVKRKGRMRARLDYRNYWKDGHWVVAIGYDKEAIFFEDPSLQAVRGYLRNAELERRWHDTGHFGVHIDHYGLALWHPTRKPSAYTGAAERIQ